MQSTKRKKEDKRFWQKPNWRLRDRNWTFTCNLCQFAAVSQTD